MNFFKRLLARLRGSRQVGLPAASPSLSSMPTPKSKGSTTTADDAIRMARAVRTPDVREAELDRWLQFTADTDVAMGDGPDSGAPTVPAAATLSQHPQASPGVRVEAPALAEDLPTTDRSPSPEPSEPDDIQEGPHPPDSVVEEIRLLLVDTAAVGELPVDMERFAPQTRKALRLAHHASPLPAPVLQDMMERFESAAGPLASDLSSEPIFVDLPRRQGPTHYSLTDLTTEISRHNRPVTLADLLGAAPPSFDVLDRLECVRLVARTVHALHATDLVTSGLSASSFGVSLDPRPQIWFLEQHLLRPVGGEVLDGSMPVRGADEDRRDLAVLIAEILDLPGQHEPGGPGSGPPTIPGLLRHQTDRVLSLLQRTDSPGRRPSAAQWLEALAA